ncbi:hypothetical protein [Dysgonomonas sp. 511]|uniref:hypothetical protein n=1 Tax=Dysgonomonas sp. 511 TaxID=2302930 RepID=UPI0013D5A7E7|nr:hypothetical protein [Dysgonomonas sp. 511]NDV77721.1 hypothetical protein [Dysgonomonas sp. 511]
MTFTDFEKTINLKNEKISEKIKHKNVGNLFFYFDKDLSSGFLDYKQIFYANNKLIDINSNE